MMIPDNAEEVPTRMIITSQEGMIQTLYIEKDEQFCPFCKVPGHPLNKCKKRQLQDKEFPEFSQPVSHRLHVRNIRRESVKLSENSANNLMPQFNGSQAAKENNEPLETREKGKEENQPQSFLWGDLIELNPTNTGDSQQKQQTNLEENPQFEEQSSLAKVSTLFDILDISVEKEAETETDTSELTELTSNELYQKFENKSKRKASKRITSPELQDQIFPKQVKTASTSLQEHSCNSSDEDSLLSDNQMDILQK